MEMENQTAAMPRIGDPAPAFEAATTQGKIDFPADFKGKWVILFSHPSAFTPVYVRRNSCSSAKWKTNSRPSAAGL